MQRLIHNKTVASRITCKMLWLCSGGFQMMPKLSSASSVTSTNNPKKDRFNLFVTDVRYSRRLHRWAVPPDQRSGTDSSSCRSRSTATGRVRSSVRRPDRRSSPAATIWTTALNSFFRAQALSETISTRLLRCSAGQPVLRPVSWAYSCVCLAWRP